MGRSAEESGHSSDVAPSTESAIGSLAGRGQPLSQADRAFFEPRFGYDFSKLRVHTDAKAAESARAFCALAYTRGSDIVFAAGRYQPHTTEGRSLLAHELVHAIQQTPTPGCGDGQSPGYRAGLPTVAARLAGMGLQVPIFRKNGGAPRGAWVTEEPAGGCGVCYGVTSKKPAAAAGKSYFGPRARPELPFSSPTDENGFLDLLVATKGGFKIAEIKPSNPKGEQQGIEDIRWYKEKMEETYPDKKVELLDERIPVGQGLTMPDPVASATGCPPQKLAVAPMRLGVYGYWCAPSFSELRRVCSCRRRRKDEPVRERAAERARKEARKRVQVYPHPYFQDFANRLPYMEAPAGRDLIVVIDDGIYEEVVTEAENLRVEQTRRLLRPADPRNIPMLVVTGYLIHNIGPIIVLDLVALAALVALSGPLAAMTETAVVAVEATVVAEATTAGIITSTIVAPAEIAAAVATGAVAAPTAAATMTVISSAGASWAVGTFTTGAAAGVIATLVAGGMGKAEAAEAAEAVKPFIGKRLLAVADVTGTDLANAKPGQEISVGGQTFRAIIRLTTPRD
jgi:hypothetical protein